MLAMITCFEIGTHWVRSTCCCILRAELRFPVLRLAMKAIRSSMLTPS